MLRGGGHADEVEQRDVRETGAGSRGEKVVEERVRRVTVPSAAARNSASKDGRVSAESVRTEGREHFKVGSDCEPRDACVGVGGG